MGKNLLYRWFGIGAIPKKIRPALATEGIVAADEGMGGWFVAKNVKGPGKRYIRRREGFVGCLVVTRKRIVCYTFGKRQMHISVDDPAVADLYADFPEKDILVVSFDAGRFRTGWQGMAGNSGIPVQNGSGGPALPGTDRGRGPAGPGGYT